MQKTLLLLLAFFFHALLCKGQNTVIDSLKIELSKANDKVSMANLHNDLAYEYLYSDAEKGISHAESALRIGTQLLRIGTQLQNDSLVGYSYQRKAMHLMTINEDSLAFISADSAMAHFKKINHNKGYGTVLFSLGWLHNERHEYPKAIERFKQANEIYYSKIFDIKQLALYNNLGVAYLQTGNYKEAIDVYFKALRVVKALGKPWQGGVVYANIGLVYKNMEDYDNALKYYALAETEYKTDATLTRIIDNYGNIANTYDAMEKKDMALSYYEKAIEKSDSAQYQFGSFNNRFNRGILLLGQNKFKSAFEDLTIGLDYFKQNNYPYEAAIANQTLAEFYLQLPDSLFKNYGLSSSKAAALKAKELSENSIKQSIDAENESTQLEGFRLLAIAWERIGNSDSSLTALKEYHQLYERISKRDIENRSEIIRQDMAFQAEQQEKILQAETEKQKTIKTAAIMVGASLLLLAIISILFYKKRRDAKTNELTARFNTLVSETEMKALRAQMNPHFIFNSLNSISTYIQKNELKKADNYLVKFARLMRLILENSEHPEISLKKDLDALELYMQLEQLRLKDGFNYTVDIDKKIDTENTLIPPLLLQPFVENSIWHGISSISNGLITVKIEQRNDQLYCTVEDNGIGRSNSAKQKTNNQNHRSLGMKITQSRIDILKQTKNVHASVHIFDLDEGTRVETILPLVLIF